jgi:redox-sensitive bicupin YhaK (pirin superfamily)
MDEPRKTSPAEAAADSGIERIIEPESHDLGGFSVLRVLPSPARRMVGPFIFFDHFGPAEFPPGEGVQVRPHPHIGLSTVTYLFEGEVLHRDSLGCVQPIHPGAVNLMTAGRGIVHSERAGDDLDRVSRLHGIQTWMALPLEQEECEPDFRHYAAADLPELEQDGVSLRVIMGEAYGRESPVTQHAPTLYVECRMPAGSELAAPQGCDELAVYVVEGDLSVGGQAVGERRMAVAAGGRLARLRAQTDCHVMLVGGAHSGERHIWWNFVSSSRERIERAGRDWREGRFAGVPGDDEFIPLPE